LKSEEELKAISEEWLTGLIDTWFWEYGAWDGFVEDEEITDDKLEWIQNNIRFTHQASIK
jgi:hypothetical protein